MKKDVTIKLDQGGINARIIAREAKADFRRVESASRKIPTSFGSPEVKRLYVRFFNIMQLNTHFISVMARSKLPQEAVEQIENSLQELIEKFTGKVNRAIDGAEALFKANGITSVASYDAEPMAFEVKVISLFGRRYLELMTKVDQLMPMLETLAIDEVIALRELEKRKSQCKRMIRQVAGAARNFKIGIQRRMNTPAESEQVISTDQDKAETLDGGTPVSGSGDAHEHSDKGALEKPGVVSVEEKAPRARKTKQVTDGVVPVSATSLSDNIVI